MNILMVGICETLWLGCGLQSVCLICLGLSDCRSRCRAKVKVLQGTVSSLADSHIKIVTSVLRIGTYYVPRVLSVNVS